MNERHKFFIAFLVLLGTVAYGVYQWNIREALLLEANQLQTSSANLTVQSKNLEQEQQEIKVEVTNERATAAQELSTVFPSEEDLTTLTRMIDEFAVTNHFETNPFFVSSLSYGEVTSEGNYRYIPVSLNIETSKKNLNKFLEYIESSGSLEGQTRLMSIEDLTVNYPAEYGGTYSVSIELDAYFSQQI